MVMKLDFACVVYVDDILLLSTTKEAEEHVVATLSSVVPVKTTGEIGEEGGSLTFIGRVIKRERDSSEITLGVDPHYLDYVSGLWCYPWV